MKKDKNKLGESTNVQEKSLTDADFPVDHRNIKLPVFPRVKPPRNKAKRPFRQSTPQDIQMVQKQKVRKVPSYSPFASKDEPPS